MPKPTIDFEFLARLVFDSLPNNPPGLIIIGYSGGPDSTALLYACARLRDKWEKFTDRGMPKPDFVAAHLDHGLRPESGADAQHCKKAAEALGFEFELGKTDLKLYHRPSKGGKETDARNARRVFWLDVIRRRTAVAEGGFHLDTDENELKELLEDFDEDEIGGEGCVAVLLAHTLNDQAETVLMNIARGAGYRGASGMRKCSFLAQFTKSAGCHAVDTVTAHIVRPFLELRREQIESLLRNDGIEYLVDSTNDDPEYGPRNKIRLNVLPALESAYPQIYESLGGFAESMREKLEEIEERAADFVERHAKEFMYYYPEFFIPGKRFIKGKLIEKEFLKSLPAPVRAEVFYRIFKSEKLKFGYRKMAEINALLSAPAGRFGPERIESTKSHLFIPFLGAELDWIEIRNPRDSFFFNGGDVFSLLKPGKPKLLESASGTVLADIIRKNKSDHFQAPNYKFIHGKSGNEEGPMGVVRTYEGDDYKRKIRALFEFEKFNRNPVLVAPVGEAVPPLRFVPVGGLTIPLQGKGRGHKDLRQHYIEAGVPPSVIDEIRVLADSQGQLLWCPAAGSYRKSVDWRCAANASKLVLLLVFLDQRFPKPDSL
ncbi:MAG: tRNA lysidine(34) synthetase TilS [bacterium]